MWLTEDVRNILTGVHMANANLAKHFNDPEVRAYREGFVAALAAAAASFGIPPADILDKDDQPTHSVQRSLMIHS